MLILSWQYKLTYTVISIRRATGVTKNFPAMRDRKLKGKIIKRIEFQLSRQGIK